MQEVLVVGASRGIGLGLADVHIAHGWKVHATTRDGSPPRRDVIAHRLDVRDVGELEDLVVSLPVLDRIIHNAGVLRAARQEMMEVNAVAPIRTVAALVDAGRIRRGGTISIMTSQLGARRGRTGSLGDYGDSKAALNDEFRKQAPVWAETGAISVVIHPGWVSTDMGGSHAPVSVEQSSVGILELMDGLTPSDNGSFLTWDGRVHPW
ncbi:MAG TPA: SDR family NAD(P)-dependent oxidoreductase [Acidimicrobiia bacterium]|nr:SDR family NAD(P)-dependent oxidoreductase [Acidimicrobiia bacterium]